MSEETPIITLWALTACLLMLIIPISISWWVGVGIIRKTILSVARMVAQLLLVGIFLEYLFLIENPLLTLAWLLIMVFFAAGSVVRSCRLRTRDFFLPVFSSLAAVLFFLLWYFLIIVMQRPTVFEVRYAIAVGGMLLGNSLKGNIIGINSFRDGIRDNLESHIYLLAMGATFFESLKPLFRRSMRAALIPMTASMSTLGLVFLPGMMTGQILGGVDPMLAVRYQVAIMVTIFTCMSLSTALALFLVARSSFLPNGMPGAVWNE